MCGLKERTIQRKLLAVADLILQAVVQKACAAELTEKETIALHGGGVEGANKVRVAFPECFRSWEVNHSSDTCFFRNSKCRGCKKIGHNVKKISHEGAKPGKWEGHLKAKTKVREKKEDTAKGSNGSDWPMFTDSDSRGKSKEFIVPVIIDGKTVDMELDTGASVTIIPKSVWTDVLASKPVERTDIKLCVIPGTKFPLLEKLRFKLRIVTKNSVICCYYWK